MAAALHVHYPKYGGRPRYFCIRIENIGELAQEITNLPLPPGHLTCRTVPSASSSAFCIGQKLTNDPRISAQTSASYYMCWHTMNEVPSLAALGEPCDNFANCLDPEFGASNRDPRADDETPFQCATYSFCPGKYLDINNLLFFRLTQRMKMEQNVPKRRHIKFRSRGIAQMKEYNIHNMAIV